MTIEEVSGDICTCLPLVLQFVETKTRSNGESDDDWEEFLHLPKDTHIFEFSEILQEIEVDIMDKGTDIRNLLLGKVENLLNFISEYCEAYSSMLDGNSQDMSTSELYGGSRIHYIFQSIFVKSLEEVDPYEDLTDDDIRTAIQNATGPRTALFVPDVPFEVLVRRQISRLLDPSLQCARFVFEELIQISHRCMMNKLQRFHVLRKRMEEVILDFLEEGLKPAEAMIRNIIDMEMDYINTSHPNFIGGTKAVEVAKEQVKSRSFLIKQTNEMEASEDMSQNLSMIYLKKPPAILRPHETYSEQEAIQIHVMNLLLKSYYDIVRKNIADSVPKAIMHFLVNHTKRELHNVFIKKLFRLFTSASLSRRWNLSCRDNLFTEMLQEPVEIKDKYNEKIKKSFRN